VTDVNSPPKAVHSLGRIKVGRQTYYVLPLRGVAYGFASLAVVFGLLLAVDRFVLGSLERGGWTAGQQWALHNKIVEENDRRKTTTNECEPRHWLGQPLYEDRPSDPAVERPRKILVIGDSFVWGPPYITLNHLWWRQLAIELERRGYRSVEVLAVGQPGWSTHRQLDCARELIPEMKPDVVIWGYVTNDPDEKVVRQIFDSQDRPPYGQRIRRRLKWLLPSLTFKFESLRGDKLAAQYTGPEYGYAYPDWELKLLEGENFARYRQTVDQVGDFLRESRIPTVLVTLPHFPGREYFEPRYAPVLPLWRAAGVQVLNTLDDFVRRYGDAPASGPESLKWGINPADSHPGPTATHFFACQAADYLEKTWQELLGPKNTLKPHELVINDWLPDDLSVRQISDGEFELDYPATTDRMLQLPAPPAALIALRFPMPIEEFRLTGADLKSARVWALLQPEEQFEKDDWHELKPAAAESHSFRMPANIAARRLSALRITAEFRGTDRKLGLSFTSAEIASNR
jgi:hypothetical protein